MHKENVTSYEEPPMGGIFLCPEIELPPLVEGLIQHMPELLEISHEAKDDLDVEYEKIAKLYADKFLYGRESELAPNAIYHRLVSHAINRGWNQKSENNQIIEDIGRLENLKSDAAAYEDARATICGFGERVVEILRSNLNNGLIMIGNRQYELIIERNNQKWFCGFDEVTSRTVIFNRWDTIETSLSRPAFLQDYVWLVGDIRMERAKLMSNYKNLYRL